MIIKRETYTNKLIKFINSELIKVITGVRRCGKSFLLSMLIDKIKSNGVDNNHIISLSMENLDLEELRDYKKLYKYITSKITDDKKYYIFIDEIQMIDKWEEVVNSLRLKNTDIYITGSNSKLLSGELATLLSGRYIEVPIRTISFSEYVSYLKEIKKEINMHTAINDYIKYGGYPLVITTGYSEDKSRTIIEDYYTSIVYKDVITRFGIKDETLLLKIIDYLFDNIGNLISIRNITNYIISQGYKTNVQTVSNYVKALEKSLIIERAPRYDIAGKELLTLIDKFYVADHSFIYVRKGYNFNYINGVLENIVYNDLKRRGYKVYVGKIKEKEVDFIAEKADEKIYVQVSYSIIDPTTKKREIEPYENIKDSYPKYIVTLDELSSGNINGIKLVYLPDFLTQENL